MACRYEEEIHERTGKVEKCGCPECPYKTLEGCYEITEKQKEERGSRVAKW